MMIASAKLLGKSFHLISFPIMERLFFSVRSGWLSPQQWLKAAYFALEPRFGMRNLIFGVTVSNPRISNTLLGNNGGSSPVALLQ
jgi:hypothetical protein